MRTKEENAAGCPIGAVGIPANRRSTVTPSSKLKDAALVCLTEAALCDPNGPEQYILLAAREVLARRVLLAEDDNKLIEGN